MPGCWCFKSLQHLGSYQDNYRLVTVLTRGDFIMLPPLANQITGTITQYPSQSHYRDTELTSPSPILLMPSTQLGSNKHQFYMSLFGLDWEPNCWHPTQKACSDLVYTMRGTHPPLKQFSYQHGTGCSLHLATLCDWRALYLNKYQYLLNEKTGVLPMQRQWSRYNSGRESKTH